MGSPFPLDRYKTRGQTGEGFLAPKEARETLSGPFRAHMYRTNTSAQGASPSLAWLLEDRLPQPKVRSMDQRRRLT